MQKNQIPKDVLPTLVIGLGGTGFQIIKRLKQLFRSRYDDEKIPVRYLLIDTDLKTFLDDDIANNEKCQLRFGDGIKNTLEWAYENPNFDWLPRNPKITPDFFTATDQGAGLVRPIGRLYLCKNAKLVYDTISTAKNDLVDLHKVLIEMKETYLENIDRHKVYIVGSLAGGTGCGTFLDVGVMVSKIFNRDNTNVIGLFTMESCYDEKLSSDLDAQNRSKANCYASLKELEFYMSSIKNTEDEKYLFKYNNIGEIRLEKKLFDICYLLENKNEVGGVLTNIEDIYDLCSLQLFQEIGTALGSQLRADYANFLCKDSDPVLKRERHFSTFSSSSMIFPVEKLKKYSSYKLAYDILGRLNTSTKAAGMDKESDKKDLINKINTLLDFDNVTVDFTGALKVNETIYYEDLKDKKMKNLDRAAEEARNQRSEWDGLRKIAAEKIKEELENFVQSKIASYGIPGIENMMREIDNFFYEQNREYTYQDKYDAGAIKSEITGIKDKKILKGKDPVPREIVNKVNLYIRQEYNNFLYKISEDRYQIVRDVAREHKDRLHALLGRIEDMKQNIKSEIERISFHSEKKYGGNIISRETLTKDYYNEFYNKKYSENLENKITMLFKDNNLMDKIKSGTEDFVKLCTEDFERINTHKGILDILKEQAESEGMNINNYVKKELDITSKLTRPFWSAVKNPEVSWTECYYVGSVRDSSNDNGFTIKAPEAIDKWIKNQTGERSRQARYVETSDPNSIDVIHIIMGACAAYLPDVRIYKQFYLKLLSSKTYPLHLNEKYVGLPEIEPELDRIFMNYSLAKAFGIIFENDNNLILNFNPNSVEQNYLYRADFIVQNEEFYNENIMELPINISGIPGNLKLGNSYTEAIGRITQESSLAGKIKAFVEAVEMKLTKDEIKEHIKKYIESNISGDFIANEKINGRILDN